MRPQLITYQVQIRIPLVIQKNYQAWLVDHVVGNPTAGILGMLELVTDAGAPLFVRAEIRQAKSPLYPDHSLYRVNYYLESLEMMELYEQQFAAEMRQQAPAEFVGKAVINRCLFLPEVIGEWSTELGAEQEAIEEWEVVI